MEESNLVAFKAICNFVTSLSEMFGETQHSLALYAHLINKTTISHDQLIEKHIALFRTFCNDNQDAIYENRLGDLKGTIAYSKRCYIVLKDIVKVADGDTKRAIHKHLLTISALLNPAGQAKQILLQNKQAAAEAGQSSGKETDFLVDLIRKVETTVDPNVSNPMEAVQSIVSSGVFTELLSGISKGIDNGDFDLSKLIGTTQKLMSSMNVEGGGGDMGGDMGGVAGGQEMMGMIQNMMGSLAASTNSTGSDGAGISSMPDLTQMIPAIMSSMAAQQGNSVGGLPDLTSMRSS